MAKQFCNELVEVLKQVKFSIIIDESIDISSKKQLAIVVRFYCDQEMRVKSRFFKLIEVTKSDAETLANGDFTQLEKNNIPCDNMIGFASDTTNVMFGTHHSGAKRKNSSFVFDEVSVSLSTLMCFTCM